MSWGIEPVATLMARANATDFAERGAMNIGVPNGFAELMERGVVELDASVGAAEAAMRDLAAGKPVELHEAMIQLERARIGVQTFVQVRNKLIESYQDLMRMQM